VGSGDLFQRPDQLRAKAAEAKRLAALTTDPIVTREILRVAATYLRDADRIEELLRNDAR
jgi:hypothetical protein